MDFSLLGKVTMSASVSCAELAGRPAAVAEYASGRSMTVAEVRRALAFIRKSWEEQQMDQHHHPFYLSGPITANPLASNQTIEEFSLTFVLAHHTRRLAKPREPEA